MRNLKVLAAALAAVLCIGAAGDPSERMKDPAQEARARHLFQQFRCLVCQNESIDDSDADLARDLRGVIRDEVAQGRTDAEIRTFLVDRYGEFILLKPILSWGNALLWLTPLVIVLAGGALFAWRSRRSSSLEPALTPVEESRLSALMDEGGLDTVRPKIGLRKGLGMTET